MPIYEYRCRSCSHKLEKLQKIRDDMLVDCPACGQPELQRLISAVAFRLKGSGWYETDFKQDNKRNLAESSDNDTSDKDSSSKDTAEKDTSDKKSSDSDSKQADKSSAKSSDKQPESKPAVKPAAKESKHA